MLPRNRVGMIIPSSNTCLEVVNSRLLAGRTDVGMHVARLGVTRITLDRESNDQFGSSAMIAAALQLVDAHVDLVVWNGTAGTWLGFDHDRELCTRVEDAIGVPVTTSALALLESLRYLRVQRLGLAVPYTEDVAAQIISEFATSGIEVVGVRALGIEENFAFARLTAEQIVEMVRDAATPDAEAVAVVCTNVPAAGLVPGLEDELRIPICDSVAVTLWHALRALGVDAAIPGWGQLLGGPSEVRS